MGLLKPLLSFGEALIDFLQIGSSNVEEDRFAEFRQFPGGAPANVAVAFARLGGEARFAGQVGNDPFGRFLENSLAHYGVDTRFLAFHPTAKTALAFVSLGSEGDRSFSSFRCAVLIRDPGLLSESHEHPDVSFDAARQALELVAAFEHGDDATRRGLVGDFHNALRHPLEISIG